MPRSVSAISGSKNNKGAPSIESAPHTLLRRYAKNLRKTRRTSVDDSYYSASEQSGRTATEPGDSYRICKSPLWPNITSPDQGLAYSCRVYDKFV